jgi:hypothetical protein
MIEKILSHLATMLKHSIAVIYWLIGKVSNVTLLQLYMISALEPADLLAPGALVLPEGVV